MKRLATAFCLLFSVSLQAQTLFYYGKDSVSEKEFLRAYQKNNTGVHTAKAFREYLDLYIISRLKVKEAKERRYDTLPQMAADLDNLRQQILPAYLNDKDAMNRLVQEAFTRSQKDIHLAHIFIATHGSADPTLKAKATAALDQLNRGQDFSAVARQYSDDPSVTLNGGDLGWITVFSLPYELENLAYATPQGKVSTIYQSRAGYHIFKNLGERRDIGKIKAAQILLAFPPDATPALKEAIHKRADSLYARIMKGDDFGKLAAEYSNDVISAAANGQMQEFGVGQYDQEFESAVFALAKDDAVTEPFLTSHGYHIVKRLSRTPVSSVNNEKTMEALRIKVEQSDRASVTKTELAQKILRGNTYSASSFEMDQLQGYSDSVLNGLRSPQPLQLKPGSSLFRIGDRTVTVNDWMGYIQTFRYKSDGSGIKSYPALWDEFKETVAIDYYQSHLEDFNEEFKWQLNEFRDGNLFFEIMQREIWGPAQTDSAALRAYFDAHQSKYNWKQSADAVIFYATDAASAKTFQEQLKKSPGSWSRLVTSFSERIAADSSRFELSQIPNPSKTALKPGMLTGIQLNKADNTASFAYILRTYPQPSPRKFDEARGLVINDYQNELEKRWLSQLRSKYPVRINEKLWNKLVGERRY